MPMIPYKLVEERFPASEDDTVRIPSRFLRFLLSRAVECAEFDEEMYLKKNPDVGVAMRKGEWESAKQHFVSTGYFEGRLGAYPGVSDAWYLKLNPDVAEAISNNEWQSAEEHYNSVGILEWRIPNKEAQPDVLLWRALIESSAD